MNREQDAALPHATVIPLRLVLRYPDPSKASNNGTRRTADAGSSQQPHDRARRDKQRPDSRNRYSANSSKKSKCAPYDSA